MILRIPNINNLGEILRKLGLILILLALVMSVNSYAGDVDVSGQIRYRFEMNNKDFNDDTAGNNYAFLRSRLGLKFEPTDDVTAFVQVQDSRTTGEEGSTLGDGSADMMDFHQAYVTINNLHGHDMSLSVGRMEVKYGGERLMGAVGWHNVGRSFDGLKLGLNLGMASVDLFNFKTMEGNASADSSDSNVYGVHADLDIGAGTTQAFLIHEQNKPAVESPMAKNLSTVGLYRKGMVGDALKYELDFGYQMGTAGVDANGADVDVAAMMLGVRFKYSMSDMPMSPKLIVGYDMLSGDDGKDETENTSFNTLFATNHKFYGYMDYFLNIPVHAYDRGLNDIVVGLKASPMDDHWVAVDFHMFSTAQDYTMANGTDMETDLGSEIDITLKRKYNSNVKFMLGYSMFTPGKIFEETMGKDSADWLYWMAIINF